MKMSSCCWGSRRVCVGGYPLPAIAGRTCCWGSGGGTPPDQLLADAAVGVRGGVPPLNQELPGSFSFKECSGLTNGRNGVAKKMLRIWRFSRGYPVPNSCARRIAVRGGIQLYCSTAGAPPSDVHGTFDRGPHFRRLHRWLHHRLY